MFVHYISPTYNLQDLYDKHLGSKVCYISQTTTFWVSDFMVLKIFDKFFSQKSFRY